MTENTNTCPHNTKTPDWTLIFVLALTPIIGLGGTAVYTAYAGFSWWMLALFLVMYLLVGISICAGYHRYFSHKSYNCHIVVQYFYAIFGAMAFQNSILQWASRHRSHHIHVDSDWDPYNIQRGFWWAHIVWIFYTTPHQTARDLSANRVVCWQERWHTAIGCVGGFGIPLAVGALFGDVWAGLLWGGFLRIVVIHHMTFFVNSLSHTFGSPEFDEEVSARDNWLVALMTLGEGYHSFHHRFPADFRNGVRWYHWDPAKWFIAALKWVGLASELHTTPAPLIEQARLRAALKRMEIKVEQAPPTVASEFRQRVQIALACLNQALLLVKQTTAESSARQRDVRRAANELIKQARREWHYALVLLMKSRARHKATV